MRMHVRMVCVCVDVCACACECVSEYTVCACVPVASGTDLETAIQGAHLVVSPSAFTGRWFVTYLRVVQCVNLGVPIVVEAGSGMGDDVVADTMSRLGGVHQVRYGDIVDTVMRLVATPAALRVSAAQMAAWRDCGLRVRGWRDGRASTLERLLRGGSESDAWS